MSRELYVKNLPAEITEEELRKLFAVAGKISYIRLGLDTKSSHNRAYAYIKMASIAEAKEAILCLDDARIGNRNIAVNIATPQKPSGPGKRQVVKNQKSANPRQRYRK
jgi:RNA recognition motif-containing protein